jgi:hypothetical protein
LVDLVERRVAEMQDQRAQEPIVAAAIMYASAAAAKPVCCLDVRTPLSMSRSMRLLIFSASDFWRVPVLLLT